MLEPSYINYEKKFEDLSISKCDFAKALRNHYNMNEMLKSEICNETVIPMYYSDFGFVQEGYEDEDGYRTYHGKIVSYHIEPTPLGFECVFDVEVKELENIILQYHTDIFSSIESDFYKLCSSLDLMDTGSSMHLYMSVGRPVVVSIDKMWQGSYCIVAMDLDTERYDRD